MIVGGRGENDRVVGPREQSKCGGRGGRVGRRDPG